MEASGFIIKPTTLLKYFAASIGIKIGVKSIIGNDLF